MCHSFLGHSSQFQRSYVFVHWNMHICALKWKHICTLSGARAECFTFIILRRHSSYIHYSYSGAAAFEYMFMCVYFRRKCFFSGRVLCFVPNLLSGGTEWANWERAPLVGGRLCFFRAKRRHKGAVCGICSFQKCCRLYRIVNLFAGSGTSKNLSTI